MKSLSKLLLWVILLASVAGLVTIGACKNDRAEHCKVCYTAFTVDQDTIFADELAEWVRNHKLGDAKPKQQRFGKKMASMRGIYCDEYYGDLSIETITDSLRARMIKSRYRDYLKSQCGEIGNFDYNGQ